MMKKYNTILLVYENDIVWLYLNRPEKSNAFNIEMIRELNEAITSTNEDDTLRFLIISSKGGSFSSGADLNWMMGAPLLSKEQNYLECLEMAELFYLLYTSKKITITLVSGSCIGGGIGLAAASDFCIAADTSYFKFGEVKLGLVPSVISPYVIQRMGYQKSKKFMLSGEKFNSQQALEMGLIDSLTGPQHLKESITPLIGNLKQGGKQALQSIKGLLNHLKPIQIDAQLKKHTAEIIAEARVSVEGKEGIQAFLEKRNPNW
jgi:methylglutaconyl-CoA hydratase